MELDGQVQQVDLAGGPNEVVPVSVSWDGATPEDKVVARSAVKQVPALRGHQRANTRKVVVVEIVALVALFVLSDLTSSNALLVVGAAALAGFAGLLSGYRMLAEQLPVISWFRFGSEVVESRVDFGVEMRVAWGPDLTVVRLTTGLVGLVAGHVVFLVGEHRLGAGQAEAILALAQAAGSPVHAVGS